MSEKIDKHLQLIFIFLDVSKNLISEKKLSKRLPVMFFRYFCLGVVDSLCQAENLDDNDMSNLLGTVFEQYGLGVNKSSIEDFIENTKRQIGEMKSIGMCMETGATAFKDYWAKNDASTTFMLKQIIEVANDLNDGYEALSEEET